MTTTFLEKKNNAKTTLSSAVDVGDLTLTVDDASLFPSSGSFLVTVWEKKSYHDPGDDSSMEIVKVTSVVGDVFTIERAQDDTTESNHTGTDAVEMLITKKHFTEIEDAIGSIEGVYLKKDGSVDLTSNWTIANNSITLINGTLTSKNLTVTSTATLGDGSLMATSAAPTIDAQIVNKKYVDDNAALLDDGTAVGQMSFWNGTTWTYAETSELFWDDTNKRIKLPNILITETFQNYNPDLTDIGVEQINDIRGYGVDYISKKLLSRVQVGTVADEVEGAIRNNAGTFQIYLNGIWNDIVINFRFREDDSGAYELEHKPVGFDSWIEVNSGNSNVLDLNGLPIIQQYKTSIGAYQVPLQIDGGTF